MPDVTYAEAVRRALIDAALADPSVVFLAEGAHDPAPVFGTLPKPEDGIDASRIIEMPTAENALVGAAIGMAMAGKKPVVSFHRVEFALLALEQIINNAAKLEFIGGHKVPLLLRLIVGRGWGQGPVHAQSLETLFAAIPGLRVGLPSTAQDAYSMIEFALRTGGPTVLIEHRWCHDLKGDLRTYSYMLKGMPALVTQGTELTVVASGYAAIEARKAVASLERLGRSADLLDLRWLRPLRLDSVFESVRRTGRLLVVDTGHRLYGVASEVITQVASECHGALKVPPRRLGLPGHPVASSRHLLPGYYPGAAEIFRTATGMLDLEVAEQLDAPSLERELIPAAIDQPDAKFGGPF